MLVIEVGEEDMPKQSKTKPQQPTAFQKRWSYLTLAAQLQEKPDVPAAIRAAQMIENFMDGKGPPTAQVATLPQGIQAAPSAVQ